MEIAVIEKIKSLPQQTEESLRDAFSVLMHTEDRKSVDHYVRWIREEAKKIRTADMYELIKQTYLYAGQYSFDDFMIAMEWNREPQARFSFPPLCRKDCINFNRQSPHRPRLWAVFLLKHIPRRGVNFLFKNFLSFFKKGLTNQKVCAIILRSTR